MLVDETGLELTGSIRLIHRSNGELGFQLLLADEDSQTPESKDVLLDLRPNGKLIIRTNESITQAEISNEGVKSTKSLIAQRAGSDDPGVGPYVMLANAEGTEQWMAQLSASGGLDIYNYHNGLWHKRATWATGGNLTPVA